MLMASESEKSRQRFYEIIDRLDEILNVVRMAGGWVDVSTVHDRLDRYVVSRRTTYRDLKMLAAMGRVDSKLKPSEIRGRYPRNEFRYFGPLFAADSPQCNCQKGGEL